MNIAVIGDILLDKYISTTPLKISDEAPVLVVHKKQELNILGGAGNVAANLAGFGHNVYLVGMLGRDPAGDIVQELCYTQKINTQYITYGQFPTIQKIRIECKDSQLVRLDIEEPQVQDIYKLPEDVDAIVLSDYNKGMLTHKSIPKILAQYSAVRKFVNGKPQNAPYYSGVDLISYNQKEFAALSQGTLGEVAELLKYSSLVVTRGENGMAGIFDGVIYEQPGVQVLPIDITGAGDVVIATLAHCTLAGKSFKECLYYANLAGSVKVCKHRTSTVSLQEINYV